MHRIRLVVLRFALFSSLVLAKAQDGSNFTATLSRDFLDNSPKAWPARM